MDELRGQVRSIISQLIGPNIELSDDDIDELIAVQTLNMLAFYSTAVRNTLMQVAELSAQPAIPEPPEYTVWCRTSEGLAIADRGMLLETYVLSARRKWVLNVRFPKDCLPDCELGGGLRVADGVVYFHAEEVLTL